MMISAELKNKIKILQIMKLIFRPQQKFSRRFILGLPGIVTSLVWRLERKKQSLSIIIERKKKKHNSINMFLYLPSELGLNYLSLSDVSSGKKNY